MKSIRRDLTVTLWVATGLLFLVAALLIFFGTRQVLVSQFDNTLRAKAEALIAAADLDDDELEFDFTVEDFAGFGSAKGGDYFEVRRDDGRLVERSPSLAGNRLPDLEPPDSDEEKIRGIHLADGAAARMLSRRLRIVDDDDRLDVVLNVASRSGDLQRSIGGLGIVLLLTCVAALGMTGFLVRFALRRGLRPLVQLGEEVEAIRPDALDRRISATSLPEELSPFASRLNDLLARVEESFERERRFSSHAAHELRTPLAELKTMAEMGATWPDEANPERCGEMLTVIGELEALLEKLSLLARADSGRLLVRNEPIDAADFLASVTDRQKASASARNLRFEIDAPDQQIKSDPVLLAAILNNLVGNATAYAPAGSEIRIHLSQSGLWMENPAPQLSQKDIGHLFERFWRLDASHSGYGHSGLGLSIVLACAKVLGATCRADLSENGWLRIELGFSRGGNPGA